MLEVVITEDNGLFRQNNRFCPLKIPYGMSEVERFLNTIGEVKKSVLKCIKIHIFVYYFTADTPLRLPISYEISPQMHFLSIAK